MNKICAYCNKPFESNNSKKTCSNECKELYRKEYFNKRKKEYNKVCIICNKDFITNHPNTKTCSKECSNKNTTNLTKKFTKDYMKTEKGKEIKKRYKKKSRIENGREPRKIKHRVKGGTIDNSITLKKLIDRDNNICHICNGECDISDFKIVNDIKICGDKYPSIDHVIPLAKNGNHSWDNVKLAHRLCNSIKSDN